MMIMKKFYFLLSLFLLPMVASADDEVNQEPEEIDGVWFYLDYTNITAEVTAPPEGNELYAGVVEIPSEFFDYGFLFRVTAIGKSAFEGCHDLTAVNIPSSVTSIANAAFWECWGLTSMVIPEGVTSIGEGAFGKCSNLSSVELPSTLKAIDEFAFALCPILTNITSWIREPFEIDYNTFGTYSAHLHVPEGTKDNYQNTKEWKLFSVEDDLIVSRTILVEEPGTLASLIPESDRYRISKMVLKGNLNGADIRLIRNMSGVDYAKSHSLTDGQFTDVETNGILTDLDLSGTTIVEGGANYYVKSNGQSNEYFYTEERTISPYMFSGTKLTSVVLPNNTSSIGKAAFSGSGALTTVMLFNNMPPSLDALAFSDAYENCVVWIPKGSLLTYQKTDGWKDVHIVKELIPGDANLDGIVNAADIVEVVNATEDSPSDKFYLPNADLNGNNQADAEDIDTIVDIIME